MQYEGYSVFYITYLEVKQAISISISYKVFLMGNAIQLHCILVFNAKDSFHGRTVKSRIQIDLPVIVFYGLQLSSNQNFSINYTNLLDNFSTVFVWFIKSFILLNNANTVAIRQLNAQIETSYIRKMHCKIENP